jgi:peptidoglycan glycosyltransferase
MATMRRVVQIGCVLVATGLIGFGMIQPVEQDARWLLALWLAAPLLFIAALAVLPPQPRGASQSVQRLAVLVGIGFVLLALQLLRQQFIHADDYYGYVSLDEQTGQSTSNVRPVIQSQRIKRGRMIDRNDVVLVDSEIVEGNRVRRIYPVPPEFDRSAFGPVVGYFSHRFGQSGLEATYSEYLTGRRDAWAQIQTGLLGRQPVGDDLHLTLDARLQNAAWRILGDRTGSIVVIEPGSGAVLALASRPGFDPAGLAFDPAAPDREAENARIAGYWEQLNQDTAGQPLLNRTTQGRYPPGSAFKTVTAVGVLEHAEQGRPNEIDCPDERFTEPGAPPVVNAVREGLEGLIRSRPAPGTPTLERVYAFSCNTAFAEYAMRLGPELMTETADRFDIVRPQDAPRAYQGFDDLLTEPSTLYAQPGFLNQRAGLADTGYGQGQLQVTPLQMAMVTAAIANDGVMMEPYLVQRVTRPDGSLVYQRGPRVIRRAMSPETAATMRRNMRAVVEYGFGQPAQQVDPSIALVGGKSGTAEHSPGVPPHAWFIAIAPVDQPRYAVAAMVENGGEGSTVGAEVAGAVLAAAFELER